METAKIVTKDGMPIAFASDGLLDLFKVAKSVDQSVDGTEFYGQGTYAGMTWKAFAEKHNIKIWYWNVIGNSFYELND